MKRVIPGVNVPEDRDMDDDIVDAEVVEPHYGQVILTEEEQQLYGETLMNLVTNSLMLLEWKDRIEKSLEPGDTDTLTDKDLVIPMELKLLLSRIAQHGIQMQQLVDIQLNKAGMKSVIT
jgi:hypothetical protein